MFDGAWHADKLENQASTWSSLQVDVSIRDIASRSYKTHRNSFITVFSPYFSLFEEEIIIVVVITSIRQDFEFKIYHYKMSYSNQALTLAFTKIAQQWKVTNSPLGNEGGNFKPKIFGNSWELNTKNVYLVERTIYNWGIEIRFPADCFFWRNFILIYFKFKLT